MPYARTADPYTSHEAAKSVNNVTQTQQAILQLLEKPMTDEQLVNAYQAGSYPAASESGIRSRRAELARKGLLVIVTTSLTANGRKARVWTVSGDC
jgi:hypothetical protein